MEEEAENKRETGWKGRSRRRVGVYNERGNVKCKRVLERGRGFWRRWRKYFGGGKVTTESG